MKNSQYSYTCFKYTHDNICTKFNSNVSYEILKILKMFPLNYFRVLFHSHMYIKARTFSSWWTFSEYFLFLIYISTLAYTQSTFALLHSCIPPTPLWMSEYFMIATHFFKNFTSHRVFTSSGDSGAIFFFYKKLILLLKKI